MKQTGIMSRATGVNMRDYLFDKTAGWIPGIVTPSGFAILFLLLIMGLFSHRLVRKSGRFEVYNNTTFASTTFPFDAALYRQVVTMTHLAFKRCEITILLQHAQQFLPWNMSEPRLVL